jgi:hypothetical protein
MAVQSYKNAELENVIFNVEDQDEWKQIAADLGLKNKWSLFNLLSLHYLIL